MLDILIWCYSIACYVISKHFLFMNINNRTTFGLLNSTGGLLLLCDLDRMVFFQLQNGVDLNRI